MGTITKIIAVIITLLSLSVIIWEYGIPLLDDRIKTPSEYINEYFEPDGQLYFKAILKNEISGFEFVRSDFKPYALQMKQFDSYSLIIESNIPFNFDNEYTFAISYQFYNYTTFSWEIIENTAFKISKWNTLLTDRWVLIENIYPYVNYQISINVYDSNGVIVNPMFSEGTIKKVAIFNIALCSPSPPFDSPIYTGDGVYFET